MDNGGAGLHPEYGPDYFAAFVIDPDGYRIKAVINQWAMLHPPCGDDLAGSTGILFA